MSSVPLVKLTPTRKVRVPSPGHFYEWPDGAIALCVGATFIGAHFAGEIGTPLFFKRLVELPVLTEMRVAPAKQTVFL
ncbi:MAG: hypothetical protein JXA21_10480 [Anaerolineae bacterium]|nr:hypothetical protein [Anaerolineae bacterium]